MMDPLSGAALLVAAFLQGQSQETGRPVLKEDDYKAIVEKNVFSPLKPKKAEKIVEKPKESKKTDPTPAAPKPPIVAAFADFNGEWRALIRDTATSQSKWYKVGESLAGGTIESIEMLKLTIKFASDTKAYRNGEALPMVNGKAAIPAKATPAVLSMEATSSAESQANQDEVRARLKRERGKKVEDDDLDTGEETPKKGIKKKD